MLGEIKRKWGIMKTIKKAIYVLLGIWCGLVCFVNPIWLIMVFLNITGIVYKYDYSMDDGTAIIIGIALFIFWILLVLFPNVYLGNKLYSMNRKYIIIHIVCVVLLSILCLSMYDWDIIEFLTA